MLTVRSSDGCSVNCDVRRQFAERGAQRLEQRLRSVNADANGVAVADRVGNGGGQRVDRALLHRLGQHAAEDAGGGARGEVDELPLHVGEARLDQRRRLQPETAAELVALARMVVALGLQRRLVDRRKLVGDGGLGLGDCVGNRGGQVDGWAPPASPR